MAVIPDYGKEIGRWPFGKHRGADERYMMEKDPGYFAKFVFPFLEYGMKRIEVWKGWWEKLYPQPQN